MITATLDEFTERCKELLGDPIKSACPRCGGEPVASYGLAGGGAGPYVLCLGCGDILIKAFDEAPEAPA